MSRKIITTNSDFLFVYEGKMTNPNGDPDMENKPRMDYDTKTNLVTDLRIKRNIREYLKDKNNKISINDQPVFVNEEGEFQENVGLQKGLNEITVEAENRFEKTSQKKFNVSANYELKVAGEETERKESLIENEKIPAKLNDIRANINSMPPLIQNNFDTLVKNMKMIDFELQFTRLPHHFLK